jgi:hypothetical protein
MTAPMSAHGTKRISQFRRMMSPSDPQLNERPSLGWLNRPNCDQVNEENR